MARLFVRIMPDMSDIGVECAAIRTFWDGILSFWILAAVFLVR